MQGFEPRLCDPETQVLPLDDIPNEKAETSARPPSRQPKLRGLKRVPYLGKCCPQAQKRLCQRLRPLRIRRSCGEVPEWSNGAAC